MFEKPFKEMLSVDVSKYVQQRDKIEYLPWAGCKMLLHENGAEEVMFWPVPGADGSTLRKSDTVFVDKDGKTNRCYEVLVHIKVDHLEWEIAYPVMNGNNPVKDNSLNQLRVHNAVRRAFVKGVAERTGLGFNLWLKDDDLPIDDGDDLSRHSLLKCRERLLQLITDKINQGIPFRVIADRLGMDEETLKSKGSAYKELDRLERTIREMVP